jgi:hypothetical protein
VTLASILGPGSIWDHLLPPWDAWWPNIIASIVWTVPVLVIQHRSLLRKHRAELLHQTERLFAALADQTDEIHDRVLGGDGQRAK